MSLLSSYCCAVTTEALSACHYIPEVRSKVFNILYDALNSENMELQQASHECMKRVSLLHISLCIVFCSHFAVHFYACLVFTGFLCFFLCLSFWSI